MEQDILAKATLIDGVAATADKDKQNEILDLHGADISQLVGGSFNDNHKNSFSDTLGRVVYAKKIFNKNDAKDERELEYWEKMKRPFLYVKGYLFDDPESDHRGAKAVSAIMREFKKQGTPLDVKMSVEGKVVDRGPDGLIKESVIRNVALTLVPANPNTATQIVENDYRNTIAKSLFTDNSDHEYVSSLMKTMIVDDPADVPNFIEEASLDKVIEKVEQARDLIKMLSIGYGAVGAPVSRVGGAVLADGKKDSGDTLTSATFDSKTIQEEEEKTKRKNILKSLILKVKKAYPDLPYNEVIELSMQILNKHIKKEEK